LVELQCADSKRLEKRDQRLLYHWLKASNRTRVLSAVMPGMSHGVESCPAAASHISPPDLDSLEFLLQRRQKRQQSDAGSFNHCLRRIVEIDSFTMLRVTPVAKWRFCRSNTRWNEFMVASSFLVCISILPRRPTDAVSNFVSG